ncbi:MAG: peroxiredoxin Q/BCP [Bradymonadia bacterium]|jgi:peroxiredoxin Q/BCP
MLQIGDRLPPFNLRDDRGASIRDSDLNTGTVVLYFYPKDDTPGCTQQACSLRDQQPDFHANGVRVYGASADDMRSHAVFRDKFDLTFPLIADPDHLLCDAVGVWGEQTYAGPGGKAHRYTGIARTTFVLQDGVVVLVMPNVDVTGHAEAVLEAALATR